MRVCVVVGARPQFIKAAELLRGADDPRLRFSVVHTGQHYDLNMSQVFFDELQLPKPDVNLEVGSASHGRQTGEIMQRFEDHLLSSDLPDWVVVFGDTNSTIAAAITAAKLDIPVAHVEAGLRSFDREMPEELNRVVADRISALLFCPSWRAVDNLATEGMTVGVHETGDIMYDSILHFGGEIERRASQIAGRMGSDRWAVATVHRAANTDRKDRLDEILACLAATDMPVVWPVHPRARQRLESSGAGIPANVRTIEPVSYLTMLAHVKSATLVLTDSGGIQKEAFWLGTPCITLRTTTEWPETVDAGWNVLVGSDAKAVAEAVARFSRGEAPPNPSNPYGDGRSAQRMAELLIMSDQIG